MNSLVSYESSDEEDEAKAKSDHIPAPSSGGTTAINGDSQQQGTSAARSADVGRKAIIGPSIGPATAPEENETDDLELPEDLSEQDLVRYLTQASHPMTELPPSPSGSPNPQTEARFKRFLELKGKGLHFNEDLASKATFRNPALLPALMSRAGLEDDVQYATSLPKSLWNLQSLPSFGYKEELLKSQQTIRDQEMAQKKQASAAGKRTIDFAPASRSGASSHTSTPG